MIQLEPVQIFLLSKMDSKGDHGEALPSLKSLMKLKKKYDAPDVMSLPEGYKSNTDKERLYLWSAENFKRQVRHKYPTLKPLCLTSKNECGTEKLTMTFLKVLYLTGFFLYFIVKLYFLTGNHFTIFSSLQLG